MLKHTKRFCDSFLARGVPGFDLAVYQRGECLLRYANGYRDLERKLPMRGTERYNIYSASKPITCTAALMLLERGLFSLEEPLSAYLPEFEAMTVKAEGGARPAARPILIKHLFEMTAGFSYRCQSPSLLRAVAETDGRAPTREAMRYLACEPLLFEPGERWEYSLCHDVLAALIEVIAGEKFESYVKRTIFDPLGMHDSTFMLPPEELDSIAEQYAFRDGRAVNVGKEIVTYKLGREYASGGAGGISTVDDYIKFLEGLRTGALLSPEMLTLMTTDRLTDSQKRTFWQRDRHGYGLGVRCSKGDPHHPDFGWGGAAGAFLAIDPEKELSLYFGMHMLSSPTQGIRSMLYRMIRAELYAPEELIDIHGELSTLYHYTLTY